MSEKRHELIEKVLNVNADDHASNEEIATIIEEALSKCDRVRCLLRRVSNERNEIKSEFNDDMERLDTEESEIQFDCPHYTSTYHGDASGGSDSRTICDICGVEL